MFKLKNSQIIRANLILIVYKKINGEKNGLGKEANRHLIEVI